ncbi:GDSL-like lipase/acylhydrolase family protein [Nocardia tenerifensis]|uniref:GDSL-like lipase/acylhydrolase family protein n=1 Tax=Nocardia tenerifensis TaxID=228006 RepID=A0A318K848_9NOCA|nr:diglucosylglycerate octanoyltransferase [Nocardia tenerifensis]PXX60223.1 GDSL-like lipase/acylhydrolase family protein [Nocardia tenerifensis]
MSSEDPIRQVPDELFRKASAKPERSIPDALFGPPPAPPVAEPAVAESEVDESGTEEETPSEPEGSLPASSVDPPPEESGDAGGVEPVAAESVVGVGPAASEGVVGVEPAVSEGEFAAAVADSEDEPRSQRPVLLVVADSLSYFGPKGGLPADHPRIWPNLVAAELDWDVELVGRIGWTCRDAYWALIGDPRVWAAVPRAGAVVFAVGGMDTLPSPLPTALRELIRYIRPPALRRQVRTAYTWLQPKLSKLGRPVALPPKVSVDYLEQSREALAQLRPELPFVAVLPSVHNCEAYGRVHSGRERAVRALRAWSARTSVPLVDLGEAVRDNIFSGDANPDGIHWGWAGHTAVANAMVKTLQEVR